MQNNRDYLFVFYVYVTNNSQSILTCQTSDNTVLGFIVRTKKIKRHVHLPPLTRIINNVFMNFFGISSLGVQKRSLRFLL